MDSMADAATSVVRYFRQKGGIAFITVLKNLSIDCDCVGYGRAAEPCMKDIGIVASLDPVACDQACMDLLIGSSDEGKAQILERIRNLNGYRVIKMAEQHKIGFRNYQMVSID